MRLSEMAVLALQANAKLSRELVQLKIENAKLRGEDLATLELELRFTHEQLAARNRALFGPSSEKRGAGASEASEKRKKAPGHGPTVQPALPRMEQVHVLEEADRRCPQCGGELEEMSGQFEESEEIDVVERSFRIVVQKRQKYRCRCGGCVETAPGPPNAMATGTPMMLDPPIVDAKAEHAAWNGEIVPSPEGFLRILPKVSFMMNGKYRIGKKSIRTLSQIPPPTKRIIMGGPQIHADTAAT